MRNLYKTFLFICILQYLNLSNSYAIGITYDWTGASSTNWNTPGNWKVGGIVQTSNYPGTSSTDIAQIGINYTFTNQPVISGAISITTLTIGTGTAATLTVNAALTVSGNITLSNNGSAGGITYNLTGTGSISCNNFYLGDNTIPPIPVLGLANTTYQTILNFSSLNLTISQNLYVTSTTNKTNIVIIIPYSTANVNNPVFNFNSGTISVGNAIETVDLNDANIGAFLIYAAVSNSAQFLMNPATGNTSLLNLNGANALGLDGNAGYIDFDGTNGGTSTVNYGGSVNQEVYTSTTPYSNTRQSPNGLDKSPAIYQNLTFSGSLTKKADGGNLTIGTNLTLAASSTEIVDFASNSPVVTVGGNFVSNTGTTLNQGGTGTMTITGTSTNAGMLNQTGSGNITFTGALSNSVSTAIIAQTGTGSIIASGGITNTGTMSQGSGTIGSVTVTGALTNAGTVTQTTGNITVNGSLINSGFLTLGSANLNISGNYTNSGIYTQSTGTTLFNGPSAQTLQGGAGAGTQFNTVNFSGAGIKTMSSGNFSVSSPSVLTMIGSSTLAAGGNLTLISASTSSATVAAIPSGASITGNVSVQRYITGGTLTYRGYRLLTSTVNTGSGIYSINYLKNYIILNATTTNGGFDNVVPANPTLYLFRENMTPAYTTFLNSNFRGINNMNSAPTYGLDDSTYPTTTIPVGNGYLCFFRGNRTSASYGAETVSTYVPQPVTLSVTGTLNQGTITVKDWFTASNLSYTATSPISVKGFNLVGNPYPSSIDWDKFGTSITETNLSLFIYILNPTNKNYRVYQSGSGGVATDGTTSSNIIPSGQGFFVQAIAANPTLIFTEAAKTNTQPPILNLYLGTPVDLTNNQYLRLQIAKDSINTDYMMIRFNSNAATAYTPNLDAPYKTGFGVVSLASLSSDNIPLAINVVPLPKSTETIGLTVSASADGIYSLNMKNIVAIPQLFDIWLMDAYKKDSLDMRHNTTYSFNIYNSDTTSYGSKRFTLVIRQNPAFAYRLLDFTASKVAGNPQVKVVWETANEGNYTKFTVERSADNGKTFNELGGIQAAGQGTYSFIDKNPFIGLNLYRLEQQDINDDITYSRIIPIQYSDLSNQLAGKKINIYPNPAAGTINLVIAADTTESTSYNIKFMSSSGTVVKEVNSPQPLWQGSINNLLPGTYIIQVTDNKNQNFIGENKFVKL